MYKVVFLVVHYLFIDGLSRVSKCRGPSQAVLVIAEKNRQKIGRRRDQDYLPFRTDRAKYPPSQSVDWLTY